MDERYLEEWKVLLDQQRQLVHVYLDALSRDELKNVVPHARSALESFSAEIEQIRRAFPLLTSLRLLACC